MPVTKMGYAVVRRDQDSGHLWLDMDPFSVLAEETRRLAAEHDARIPGWASANRIERYVRVKIVETVAPMERGVRE